MINKKPLKKLIIIEGISSSGKTTVQRLLKERLSKAGSVKTLSEGTTLISLVRNRSKKSALDHLKRLLSKMETSRYDFYITDRFHLTHIFRTNSNPAYFRKLEKTMLTWFDVLLVLLVIDRRFIRKSLEHTFSIRKSLGKGKRGTIDDRVAYYEDQQEKLLKAAKASSLRLLRINTTKSALKGTEWDGYVNKILKL